MALKKQPSTFFSRLHFVIRLLGLTGLALAVVTLGLALIEGLLHVAWGESGLAWTKLQETGATLQRVLTRGSPTGYHEWVILLLAAGVASGLFALLIEAMLVLRVAAGRRSAFGFNVGVQILLAGLLLVIVNAYSFHHYARYDWTKNQQLTLPEPLQNELRKLQGDTTIVVYLRHRSFGERVADLEPETRSYVRAAEHMVIEKLKDRVEQFREFGKRFRVVVLDEDDWRNYHRMLAEETKDRPELNKAIREAQENTVFFTAEGQVQRLTFNDLFLLDRQASQQDNDKKGNLVLLDQGVAPLARKILTLNEKRPMVGIAVIHELLTTQGDEEYPYTMAGLKKALTARGFDTKDIVLKKWSEFGPPEAAVYTPEDSKLDELEEQIAIHDFNIRQLSTALAGQAKVLNAWKTATLEELTKRYAQSLGIQKVTKEIRVEVVEDLEFDVTALKRSLDDQEQRRKTAGEERAKLNVDTLAAQRRITDMKAKLSWTLADCDLLIVPRMTQRNVARRNDNIPGWLHRLDESQADVIRDFMKAGKPVLFCFGPTNDPPDRGAAPAGAQPDQVEQMLGHLGVKLPPQTILFDTDTEAFAARAGSPFGSPARSEPPAVDFDWKPGAGRPNRAGRSTDVLPPHPIHESMKLLARSFSTDAQGKALLADLRLRHPQPVYYDPPPGTRLDFDPELMMTSPASWNEDNPFPTPQRTPKFELPKTDPKKGTVEEKRRGPFPIAAAFTARVPEAWYAELPRKPTVVRLAVIGHGGVFNGATLSPVREMFLVDTCNWLLGRDHELALKADVWKYPRVELTPRAYHMWAWAWLALAIVFAFLGTAVWLVRHVR
ncbi:hypothetical protein AYO44_02725 [Planctomycetaceae bacterium SCGC AG-212-F19]|nr:hypothetical protein AYO44_02725 [Planctomycetaceae bacterium SCGC AG-212-F19]